MIPARSVRALLVADSSRPGHIATLSDRVRRLGIEDVVVVGADTDNPADRLGDLAACIHGRTVVIDCDLIVADACLGQLVDDPAVATGALIDAGRPRGSGQPVRVVQKRVASAGSLLHQVSAPTGAFLGAFVIDEAHSQAAADAIDAASYQLPEDVQAHLLPRLSDPTEPPPADPTPADLSPVDLALVAMIRAQIPVSGVGAVGPVLRGGAEGERESVQGELSGIDEARVLLERANRPDDGFYSTFVLRRASKPVTAAALRLGLRPNQISLISLAVGLSAAVLFATGNSAAVLIGALLMQASLVIDCVDGEVARFTRTFSSLGAWLDAATDRVKEYAAYAGLAIGAGRGGDDVWMLAVLVMIMQTVRHVGDYDFSRVQRIRESWVPAHPFAQRSDGGAAGAGATLELSAQLNRNDSVRWAKKVLHMPIGERWLVLSVGAVAFGAAGTFIALLALGLLALAYTTAGRILRTRTWSHPADRSGAHLLEPQLDLGPLGEPLWTRTVGRWHPFAASAGWALPAVMRVLELGGAWLLVALVIPDDGARLFAWVFVVAFHHYDTLYRALGGASPPRWLVWGGLGWDGRTLVLVIAALIGAPTFAALLGWGSAALAVLFIAVASAQWVQWLRREEAGQSTSVAGAQGSSEQADEQEEAGRA